MACFDSKRVVFREYKKSVTTADNEGSAIESDIPSIGTFFYVFHCSYARFTTGLVGVTEVELRLIPPGEDSEVAPANAASLPLPEDGMLIFPPAVIPATSDVSGSPSNNQEAAIQRHFVVPGGWKLRARTHHTGGGQPPVGSIIVLRIAYMIMQDGEELPIL